MKRKLTHPHIKQFRFTIQFLRIVSPTESAAKMDANMQRMCTTAIRGLSITAEPSASEFAIVTRILVPAGAAVKVCAAKHLVVAAPALRAFAPWATVAGPASVADVLAAVRASLTASPPPALKVASPFGPDAAPSWADLLGARVRFEGFFEEEEEEEEKEEGHGEEKAAAPPAAAAAGQQQQQQQQQPAPARAAPPPPRPPPRPRRYTVALGV